MLFKKEKKSQIFIIEADAENFLNFLYTLNNTLL